MGAPNLRGQRGLSLIELMVGLAIGLFITATSATLMSSHLRENRALLIEARLMQDLRTAADVVTRDLRRAGHWADSTAGVWLPGTSATRPNPYAALAPGSAASDAVSFRYSRDASENNLVDGNEQFGFRLRNGTIEMLLGAGNWQALTDAGTLFVTTFSVAPGIETLSLEAMCSKSCPAGDTSCPPRQHVRSLALLISGRAVTDSHVTRSVRSNVRIRNDLFTGSCPV